MSNFKAVPHTNELLSKITSQRQKNVFDRIELNAFKALGCCLYLELPLAYGQVCSPAPHK